MNSHCNLASGGLGRVHQRVSCINWNVHVEELYFRIGCNGLSEVFSRMEDKLVQIVERLNKQVL